MAGFADIAPDREREGKQIERASDNAIYVRAAYGRCARFEKMAAIANNLARLNQ